MNSFCEGADERGGVFGDLHDVLGAVVVPEGEFDWVDVVLDDALCPGGGGAGEAVVDLGVFEFEAEVCGDFGQVKRTIDKPRVRF